MATMAKFEKAPAAAASRAIIVYLEPDHGFVYSGSCQTESVGVGLPDLDERGILYRHFPHDGT